MRLKPRKSCPICGGTRLERFHAFRYLPRHPQMKAYQAGERAISDEAESEPVAVCHDCHGLFRENVIDIDALFDNYKGRSASWSEEKVLDHLNREFDSYRSGNEKYVGEKDYILSLVPAGARVLDVGSREAVLARALGEAGYDVTVVEPTQAFSQAVSKHFGVKTICGFFEKGIVPSGSYDIITAFNVLHRVDEIGDFIAAAHDQLTETGHLALCTNNVFALTHNYLTQQHRIFFTPRSIELALARRGFIVEDSRTVLWNGIPRLLTLARKGEGKMNSDALDSLEDLKTGLLRADFGFVPPFGLISMHGPLLRIADRLGFPAGRLVRHLDRLVLKFGSGK